MSEHNRRTNNNLHRQSEPRYHQSEYHPYDMDTDSAVCPDGYPQKLIARDACPISKLQSRCDSARTDSGFESIRSDKYVSSDSGVYSTDLSSSNKLQSSCSDKGFDSGSIVDEEQEAAVTDRLGSLKLYDCVSQAKEEVAKVKVDMENPYIPDDDGDTLLHVAIIHLLYHLVIYLIQKVPDISFLSEPNKLYQTPLHLAVITKQSQVVRRLVLAGAVTDARDRKGNTALHLACERGDLDSARALLQPPRMDETDFVTNAYYSQQSQQLDLELRNYDGKMCMHLAVLNRKPEMVKFLVEYGANVNPEDGTSGRTPLHYAVELQDWEITSYLAAKGGVRLDAQTFGGYTPIQYAYCGSHKIVACLLNNGATDMGLPLSDSETDNSSAEDITEMESDDVEFVVKNKPLLQSSQQLSKQVKIH